MRRSAAHLLLATLLLVACTGTGTIQTSEEVAEANPTRSPTALPTPSPTPEPVRHEFSGTGDKVLGPVELAEGVLTIVASHSGTANFVVKIVGAQGADELSINHIGRYAGARAHAVSERQIIGLQPGANRIQVEADGRWTLRLGQEFPSAGEPPSIQHQDSGDDVLSWLLLREGQYTLDASHNGSSNFVVRLIKSDGSVDSLLVNQIGSYSGEKLIQVSRRSLGINPSPGLYALAVEADGDWSVGLR